MGAPWPGTPSRAARCGRRRWRRGCRASSRRAGASGAARRGRGPAGRRRDQPRIARGRLRPRRNGAQPSTISGGTASGQPLAPRRPIHGVELDEPVGQGREPERRRASPRTPAWSAAMWSMNPSCCATVSGSSPAGTSQGRRRASAARHPNRCGRGPPPHRRPRGRSRPAAASSSPVRHTVSGRAEQVTGGPHDPVVVDVEVLDDVGLAVDRAPARTRAPDRESRGRHRLPAVPLPASSSSIEEATGRASELVGSACSDMAPASPTDRAAALAVPAATRSATLPRTLLAIHLPLPGATT